MLSDKGFFVNITTSDHYARPFVIDDADYVALHNGVEYAITLNNNRTIIADADISIDGGLIGTFRLDPYKSFRIERPADNQRKFTFKSELSADAIEAGTIPGDIDNGLIDVTFKPAKYERDISPNRRAMFRSPTRTYGTVLPQQRGAPIQSRQGASGSIRSSNFRSGVTLLGDRSYQEFNNTTALRPDQIDYSNVTQIILRLVVDDMPSYETISRRSRSPQRYPPRIEKYK